MSESTPETTSTPLSEKPNRFLLLFEIFVLLPVVLFLAPFVILYLIFEKIKFIGAPKECCRAGCSGCPWGDLGYIGWRRTYKRWRKTNKCHRCPKPRIKPDGSIQEYNFRKINE
jgi:hypothetical protein